MCAIRYDIFCQNEVEDVQRDVEFYCQLFRKVVCMWNISPVLEFIQILNDACFWEYTQFYFCRLNNQCAIQFSITFCDAVQPETSKMNQEHINL